MIKDKSNVSIMNFSIFKNVCKTFYKYDHTNKDNRYQLCSQFGIKLLVSKENSKFSVQLYIHADHENQGMTPAHITITLKQLELGLNQTQSKNYQQQKFLPQHKGGVNPRAVKDHNTTYKLILCTVAQKNGCFRIHEEFLQFI